MRKQTTGMLNLTNTNGDNLNQRDHHDKGITPIIDAAWWFGTFFLFSHILGIVTPADELIFFRGVGQPPTRMSGMKSLGFRPIGMGTELGPWAKIVEASPWCCGDGVSGFSKSQPL